MVKATPVRLVVIGNSGSGKSTFAKQACSVLHLLPYDLDVMFWHLDGGTRAEDEAKALVVEASGRSGWVIEGVYEWLIEIAMVRAKALVWLDLSWDECREGLLQRGPHYGMNPGDPDALKAWERVHSERLAGQTRLYDEFGGYKVRLRTRREMAVFSEESTKTLLRL